LASSQFSALSTIPIPVFARACGAGAGGRPGRVDDGLRRLRRLFRLLGGAEIRDGVGVDVGGFALTGRDLVPVAVLGAADRADLGIGRQLRHHRGVLAGLGAQARARLGEQAAGQGDEDRRRRALAQ
jgi:hypothetical protein